MTGPAPRCGNCREPMQPLGLEGHYGRPVEIDTCAHCHLIWFDSVEAARLTGPSLLTLLREMAAAQRIPHRTLGDLRCARCSGRLKQVHNRSRWGQTLQFECLRQHGAYQTFAAFLSEKGLVRPMSSADRAALLAAGGIDCLNCGAALAAGDATCSYCESVPGMFDVARLARALDPEGATRDNGVHRTQARRESRECLACGAAIPGEQSVRCLQCGATLAVGRVTDALDAVGSLETALREHQRNPAPHVKAQRLARLQGDLDRRRAWNREMEDSARADRTRGGGGWPVDGDDDGPLAGHPVARIAGGVALLLMVWALLGR